MCQVRFQQSFNGLRRVLCGEVPIDLLSDIGIRAKTPSREQVIAFNRVICLAQRNLGGDQADVADVVLGTGMVAACQMNVQRGVNLHARLAPVGNRGGVTLGVGGGKLAAGISSARDQAGPDLRCLG